MEIEITEKQLIPPVVRSAEGVSYSATYTANGESFTARLELREGFQMLCVSADAPSEPANFAATNPPLALYEPAFVAWLRMFMAEAKDRFAKRYEAAPV